MPIWFALIVQEPAETNVMLRLFAGVIVQTAGVVDVKVTGNPELAVAPEASGDALNSWAPGLLKVIVCEAAAIDILTTCEFVPALLVAVTVKLYGPATVGVPDSTAPVNVTPGGGVPAVIENVGAGDPVAVKVCV